MTGSLGNSEFCFPGISMFDEFSRNKIQGVSVGRGSWVVGPKSWFVGPKSWVVGSKSWVVGPKSWVVGSKSWVVGRGSWVIDWKGSALARRQFSGIPSISKRNPFKSTTTNNTLFLSVNSRETYSILHTMDQNSDSEICIAKNN